MLRQKRKSKHAACLAAQTSTRDLRLSGINWTFLWGEELVFSMNGITVSYYGIRRGAMGKKGLNLLMGASRGSQRDLLTRKNGTQ